MFLLLNYFYNKVVFRPSVCWSGGWYTTTPLDIRVPCWRGDRLPDLQMLGLEYGLCKDGSVNCNQVTLYQGQIYDKSGVT